MADDDHDALPAAGQDLPLARHRLAGQQPPFGTRASLGPEPPAGGQHARRPPAEAGSDFGAPAGWTPFGPRPALDSGDTAGWAASDPAPAAGGRAGRHGRPAGASPSTADYSRPAAGRLLPADSQDTSGPDTYGLDDYGPAAQTFGPEVYDAGDAYGPEDEYGPEQGHAAADPYGPEDEYGPEAYGGGYADCPEAYGEEYAYSPEPCRPESYDLETYDLEETDGPLDSYGLTDTRGLAGIPAPAGAAWPARRRTVPAGWRRVLRHAAGGLRQLPSSAAQLRRQDMIGRIRAPVAGGHHRVAIMSLQGGAGKTTITMELGRTLASLRADRIIAVDASPAAWALSDQARLPAGATVGDLLHEPSRIRGYADMQAFTFQAPSGLEVLAADRDPAVSAALSAEDYCTVCGVLQLYYSICLTDCGTGLLHSAMSGVLSLADQIVLVGRPSADGARSVIAALDWLAAHSCEHLIRNAVVVLCAVRPRSGRAADSDRLDEQLAARCRAVARIPYDSHLAGGAVMQPGQLSRATADAYLALTALIGDGLGTPRPTTGRGPG